MESHWAITTHSHKNRYKRTSCLLPVIRERGKDRRRLYGCLERTHTHTETLQKLMFNNLWSKCLWTKRLKRHTKKQSDWSNVCNIVRTMHKCFLWLLVLAFIFLASCFPFFCLFSTNAFTHVYVAVLFLCQQAHTHTHMHHIINLVPVSQTDSHTRTHCRFTQWRYKQHATAALRHKDRARRLEGKMYVPHMSRAEEA